MASGGEELCLSIVILLGLLLGIYIFLKLLKYAGYLGQYRAGKAMKKISKDGVTVNMPQQQQYQPPPPPQNARNLQYNPPPQQYTPPPPQQQPMAPSKPMDVRNCPKCGLLLEEEWVKCPRCRTVVRKSCPKCERILPVGYAACPHCGHDFEDQEETERKPASKALICPHCGEAVEAGKYCESCGEPIY